MLDDLHVVVFSTTRFILLYYNICQSDMSLKRCVFESLFQIRRFAVSFTYYGISFNITGFGLNIYLTQFVYGVIEIPAKVGTYLVLDRIGRRNGQAWSLIIAGSLIGLNSVIPTSRFSTALLCQQNRDNKLFSLKFKNSTQY